MKTVSITVEDAAWEAVQRLAHDQGKGVNDLISNALASLAAHGATTAPSPGQQRPVWDKLWERMDACNVEVGERPTRARTYGRDLHRPQRARIRAKAQALHVGHGPHPRR